MTRAHAVILLSIDTRKSICRRYVGKRCTDVFEVVGAITAEKVHAMLTAPAETGETIHDPEVA